MSASRIILAAIVGGLVVFCWGAVSHMVLPFGEMGIKNLPGEEVLVAAMKASMTERGFYLFPGMEQRGKDMTEAEQKAWEEKYRRGPRGVVVFDPSGSEAMSATMLGAEFASNAFSALILAIVLAHTRAGRGKRVLLATALGIFAWASIDVSYWNWYRFPDLFACSALIDQGIGWLLGGAAIALILGRPKHADTAAQ